MKMNKRFVFPFLISALVLNVAFAEEPAVKAEPATTGSSKPKVLKGKVKKAGSSQTSTGGTSVPNNESRVKPGSTRVAGADAGQQGCIKMVDAEALSYDFVKKLFADENTDINMEITPDGKFKYKIPKYYNKCGDIIPLANKIEGSNDYSVSFVVRNGTRDLKHDEVIDCLVREGVVNGDGEMDADVASQNLSSVIISSPNNILKDFKSTNSSKLIMSWPKDFEDSYPTNYSSASPASASDFEKECTAYKTADFVKGYLTERDLWLSKVEQACNGKSSAEDIMKLKNDIKNIKSLADIMDNVSSVLDGQYILKSLEDVEKNYLKPLSEMEQRIGTDQIKDRVKLMNEVNKYESLMRKMEKDVIEPLQARINELSSQRSSAEGEELKRIDDEIFKLKEGMKSLVRSNSAYFNSMMQKLANEGVSTQSKNIMVVNEKARLYTLYNEDKIKNYADVAKRLKAYDVARTEQTNLWRDMHAVKNGDKEPLERYNRMLNNDRKRLEASWKKTQEQMQKTINKDCTGFFVNQQKCAKAIQAAQKQKAQAERSMAKKISGVQKTMNQRTMLMDGYYKYQEEQAALEEREVEDDSVADLGSAEELLPNWFTEGRSQGGAPQQYQNFGYQQNQGMPMGQNYGGMMMQGMPQMGGGQMYPQGGYSQGFPIQ